MANWYVYILRCADGSYYVGHTQDLTGRVEAHNSGDAARYTSLRRPVTLAYSETVEGELEAIRRERQIKGWTRAKKQALMSGDRRQLKRMSKKHR